MLFRLRVQHQFFGELNDLRSILGSRRIDKLGQSGSDVSVLGQHLRKLGFKLIGHLQNVCHFGLNVPKHELRQKAKRRQSIFLLLDKMWMQNHGDGLGGIPGPSARLGRPDQFNMQIVVFDFHRFWDFELQRALLLLSPAHADFLSFYLACSARSEIDNCRLLRERQ